MFDTISFYILDTEELKNSKRFHTHSTFPCYTGPKGGALMATLLIVEDDHKTNDAICEYLKPTGHSLIPAYDGSEALQLFRENSIDLVVLDIMLPHVSGLSVLHEIRRTSTTPVLMLTAIEDEYTQVMSFDEQADDYMTKPFSMVLLGKRVLALLRRSGRIPEMDIWKYGDIKVDFNGYLAERGGDPVELAPMAGAGWHGCRPGAVSAGFLPENRFTAVLRHLFPHGGGTALLSCTASDASAGS